MSALFATVGDNCIDRYLSPIGHSTVGGNAVNVAVQAARLWQPVACFTAVGDDDAGQRVRQALIAAKVDVAAVHCRTAQPTAWTDLTLDANGDRHIGHEEFGACAGYRPSTADLARLRTAAQVHISWLDDDVATARALAAAGISISLDMAVNPHVAAGARVFASAPEGEVTAGQLTARATEMGAVTVIVTLGGAGALAFINGQRLRSHAGPPAVVDTLGAGDSFAAGFLVARLNGATPQSCLQVGHDLAHRPAAIGADSRKCPGRFSRSISLRRADRPWCG